MVAFPDFSKLAGNPTQAEFKEAIMAFLNATRALPGGLPGDGPIDTSVLWISGSAATPTQGFHRLALREGDTATLNYLYTSDLPNGWFLFLQGAYLKTITLKRLAGQGDGALLLPSDIVLDSEYKGVLLRRWIDRWMFVTSLGLF